MCRVVRDIKLFILNKSECINIKKSGRRDAQDKISNKYAIQNIMLNSSHM